MTDLTAEDKAFQALDTEKLKADLLPDLEKKAEEIAERKTAEKLAGLSKAISGEEEDKYGWSAKDKSGKPAPKSWEEGADKIASRAKEEAKKEVFAEIDARDKKKADEMKALDDNKKTKMDEMIKDWDNDWRALVDEGDMPGMSDDTRKALKEDPRKVDVSKDKGLSARWQLIQAARSEMERTGEKVNLYRFAKNKYSRSAGMNAPVMGGSTGYVEQDNEPTYEEIHAEAQKHIR